MENKVNRKKERIKRFKKIASRRTDLVLHYLSLLGNCSNKSAYSYNEDDVRKIFSVIDEQLRITKAKFKGRRNKSKFKL